MAVRLLLMVFGYVGLFMFTLLQLYALSQEFSGVRLMAILVAALGLLGLIAAIRRSGCQRCGV
jgi:hypothetical protein